MRDRGPFAGVPVPPRRFPVRLSVMLRAPRGFTLVELLVTVLVLVIVLALAVPSLRELTLNHQRATQFNAMLASLNLARAEAVIRGTRTVVCITNGGTAPGCDEASTQWEAGWIVFIDGNRVGSSIGALDDPQDVNGNGAWDRDEDLLLQVQPALAAGFTLRGNNNLARRIGFGPRGSTGNNGTLRLCDQRAAAEARGIVIDVTGRARQAVDSNGDGIVDVGGVNLSCP